MNDLIKYALENLYGIQELPTKEKNNPQIMKMYHEIGHQWVKNDELAWCAAAHSWIHKQLNYPYTGKLNARSWEDFGNKLDKPKFGCTVVFWRVDPSTGYGHVGFFIRETENSIFVLGGNQSNSYNIQEYSKRMLLGYREILKI